MSDVKTPASFIAASALAIFLVTILATIETGSLIVFLIGAALTMIVPRAMIGDVE